MSALRNLLRLKYSTKFIKYRSNTIYSKNHQSPYWISTNVNMKANNTVKDIVEYWRCRFKDEGIPEPLESIQHILSHVLNVRKCLELTKLHNRRLSETQTNNLEILCLCRLSRMPIQYIIGEWTFRDIVVKLVPPIFIPRSETEILVDFVIKRIFDRNRVKNTTTNILEIGCGSGAISLAILHSCRNITGIKCIAIDKNPYACEVATDNAQRLGLNNHITVINATIGDNGEIMSAPGQPDIDFYNEQCDVVVSNPPYIPTRNITELASEIKIYEDIGALDGGADGLRIIKSIIKYASKGLKPSGHLFMEVDSTHPKSIQFFVAKFADNMKLKYENTYKDYCNSERFVEISKIGQVRR